MNSHQRRKLRKKQKHSRQVLGKIVTDEDARIRWNFFTTLRKLLNLNEDVTRWGGVTYWYEFTTKPVKRKSALFMGRLDGI